MEFNESLDAVAKKIGESKGKNCLVYTHDDPDGLASAVILNRLLEKSGAKVTCRIPTTMELEKFRIEEELKTQKFDMLFIADKATMGYYNEYPDLIEEVIIIDHHPLIGNLPLRCTVCNPSIPQYSWCSASIVCNFVAEKMGQRDDFTDYQTLIGLKCDWAVDPAIDRISPFCSKFYDQALKKFPELLKKIPAGADVRPTMFEVSQREKTTLLNLIGEFFFALSGGGFQYFYNDRLPELSGISQPEFTLKLMKGIKITESGDFGAFIAALPEKELAKKIFRCFLDDWEKSLKMFDNTVLLENVDGMNVYMNVGSNIPLMPMVGSVKLNQLGNPAALVMVNWLGKEKGVHFSFRANADKVHWGNVAAKMTEIMTSKFGHKGIITGGGHPVAAEFRTRTSGVTLNEALKAFFEARNK